MGAGKRALRWLARLLVAAVALRAMPSGEGGTIYWNMNDPATPTSNDVANLTVGSLTQGNTTTTGTSAAVVSGSYAFTLNGTSTSASGGNNLYFSAKTGSLNTGSSSFLSLMLTPDVGSSGTVTAIGFGSRSTGGGPTTLSLRSSVDGYAADVATFTTSTNSSWAYFTNTLAAPIAFTNFQPLTLRLYGTGGSSVAAGNWRIDDLQVGVVVVPEPAAVILAVLGLAGGIVIVRRSPRPSIGASLPCASRVRHLRSSSCSSSSPSSDS